MSSTSSSQWLETIVENCDDECCSSSDSSDYSEQSDIEEHLAFLQGFDDVNVQQDAELQESAECADSRSPRAKTSSTASVIAPSRKIIKMYHKICKRSRKNVRASMNPHQYLKSRDCLTELVSEIFEYKYEL